MNTLMPRFAQDSAQKSTLGFAQTKAAVLAIISAIPDPEIPVINLAELGIIGEVVCDQAGIIIGVRPTYLGCPATDDIIRSIKQAVLAAGFAQPTVQLQYSPAWSSNELSEAVKAKLQAYGIAPPNLGNASDDNTCATANFGKPRQCPRCASKHYECINAFGSTPCKALYRCLDCLEPFEYFKCH